MSLQYLDTKVFKTPVMLLGFFLLSLFPCKAIEKSNKLDKVNEKTDKLNEIKTKSLDKGASKDQSKEQNISTPDIESFDPDEDLFDKEIEAIPINPQNAPASEVDFLSGITNLHLGFAPLFLYNPTGKFTVEKFLSPVYMGSVIYTLPKNIFIKYCKFQIGLGFTLRRYCFLQPSYKLGTNQSDKTSFKEPKQTEDDIEKLISSRFCINYFDFLILKLKFHTNSLESDKGFYTTLGGAFSLACSEYITYKYIKKTLNEGDKKVKKTEKQNLQVRLLRISLAFEVGYSKLCLFYHTDVTPIFKKNKTDLRIKDPLYTFQTGVSWALF